MSKLIRLEHVYKTYPLEGGDVTAVKDVSFTINQGDFAVLMGPSGSGKSTAMHLVGCLDTATKGAIFLGNQNTSNLAESDLAQIRGKKIGFIFQTFNLVPSLTALDNVALPMLFQQVFRRQRLQKST